MTSTALAPDLTTTSAAARLLTLDGALCAAMGVVMAAGTGRVCDLLGTSSTGVVRVVGIALLLYGVDLLASARTRWARRMLTAVGVGNIGWEVASLAVAALADLSSTGRVLVAVQGLVVGVLGVVQLRAARR